MYSSYSSMSKRSLYSSKGSHIPNLSYSSDPDTFNRNICIYCFISESNLIRVIEFDCSDLVKIKCLGFLMEIKKRSQTYRGNADTLKREDGWVTLCSKILKNNYGTRDYHSVIQILKELELIEEDPRYKIRHRSAGTDGFSKSFRLTEKAKDGRAAFYVKYTGKIMDYLNGKRLSNKASEDKNALVTVLMDNLRSVSLCDSPENITEKYPSIKTHESACSYDALCDIKNKEFYMIECKKTGRRFHNLLGVSRNSRKAILIDGQKCTEVDYSACHPWLCYSFYEKTDSEERREYLKSLNYGFYRYIGEGIGADISSDEKYQDFKISCIAQIFYDSPREQDGLKLRFFQSRFPNLYHVIQAEKHKSNSDFAYKLQKMEASLMFDGAFFGLYRENIKAVPIHDGVICKKSDALRVKEIMEKEFFGIYQYFPKVGIKDLTY